jgi:hypothetical protein
MEWWDEWTVFSASQKILHQPWATNLLPEEINLDWSNSTRDMCARYVGTVSNSGASDNLSYVAGFADACSSKGVRFECYGGYTGGFSHPNITVRTGFIDNDSHRELITKSYLAPQFCSKFQLEVGYVPCRIFKNISYGQYGLTNMPELQRIFDGKLITASSGAELFEAAESGKQKQDLRELMMLVRDKHTYVSRVKTILKALEQV